jgi:hypothetical protein
MRTQLVQLARIARAVLDFAGVRQLHAGPTGRIASVTPTGRVVGLLFQGHALTVGVIASPEVAAEQVIASVRKAVQPMIPSPMSIAVVVSSARLRHANF